MELGGKTQPGVLRDYQMHPFRPIVLHIDFQRVDATTKVTKKVPLHFVNGRTRRPSRPTSAWSTTWSRTADPVPGIRSCPSSPDHRPANPAKGPVAARQRPEAARGHQGRHARQALIRSSCRSDAGRRGRSRAGAGGAAPPPRRPRPRRTRAEQEVRRSLRRRASPALAGPASGLFHARTTPIIRRMIRLLVGPGNPGADRSHPPQRRLLVHRTKWRAQGGVAPERSYFSLAARANTAHGPVWLLEPMTFMNLSGKSVAALARFLQDRASGDPGRSRRARPAARPGKMKLGGSHAGPQRPADIHAQLGSADYWRLRLGIRPPGREGRGGELRAEEAFGRAPRGDREDHRANRSRRSTCWPARWSAR